MLFFALDGHAVIIVIVISMTASLYVILYNKVLYNNRCLSFIIIDVIFDAK